MTDVQSIQAYNIYKIKDLILSTYLKCFEYNKNKSVKDGKNVLVFSSHYTFSYIYVSYLYIFVRVFYVTTLFTNRLCNYFKQLFKQYILSQLILIHNGTTHFIGAFYGSSLKKICLLLSTPNNNGFDFSVVCWSAHSSWESARIPTVSPESPPPPSQHKELIQHTLAIQNRSNQLSN